MVIQLLLPKDFSCDVQKQSKEKCDLRVAKGKAVEIEVVDGGTGHLMLILEARAHIPSSTILSFPTDPIVA